MKNAELTLFWAVEIVLSLVAFGGVIALLTGLYKDYRADRAK